MYFKNSGNPAFWMIPNFGCKLYKFYVNTSDSRVIRDKDRQGIFYHSNTFHSEWGEKVKPQGVDLGKNLKNPLGNLYIYIICRHTLKI